MNTVFNNGIPKYSPTYWVVPVSNSDTVNGQALLDLHAIVKTFTPGGNPLGVFNRAVLFLLPGTYDIGFNLVAIDTAYVDIIGIGDPSDIIIRGMNAGGVINVGAANIDYRLHNVSVLPGASTTAIQHAALATVDIGNWKNLILYGGTTENTNWNGHYESIDSTSSNDVLNGSIGGTVLNCKFNANSCGFSSTANISISGRITNCTGFDNCFGSSTFGSVVVSGFINSCSAQENSFGFATTTCTISGEIGNCTGAVACFGIGADVSISSGKIYDCESNTGCFLVGSASVSMISASVENCKMDGGNGFAYSLAGTVTIDSRSRFLGCTATGDNNFVVGSDITFDGLISSCKSNNSSFCRGDDVVSFTGTISDCAGLTTCFVTHFGAGGSLTVSGVISNCKATTQSFVYASTVATTFSGMITGCIGTNSCFVVSTGAVTMQSGAKISNCTGAVTCFVCSNASNAIMQIGSEISNSSINQVGFVYGELSATVAGMISNCYSENGNAFAFAGGDSTITGTIVDCISISPNCFGYSATGNVIISGYISGCQSTSASFGSGADVTISGSISGCTASSASFGVATGTCLISGTISDCNGGANSFGATTSTGKLRRCTRTTHRTGAHAGTIESCTFSENSAVNPAITVAAGAKLKYSTIYQAGAADTITAAGAITASIYHCAMNKAENVLVTNDIATPYNVVDVNITA